VSATRDAGRRARGADGRAAELVIVGSFALVVSGAFLWALVLHDRPPSHRRSSAAQTVAATTTPTVA
jgi:hypothetical protein